MKETALRVNANYTLSINGTTGNQSIDTADVIRLCPTVDCFVAIASGVSTAATVAASIFLPAYCIEYFSAEGLTGIYIAAITSGATGSLYIGKCNA